MRAARKPDRAPSSEGARRTSEAPSSHARRRGATSSAGAHASDARVVVGFVTPPLARALEAVWGEVIVCSDLGQALLAAARHRPPAIIIDEDCIEAPELLVAELRATLGAACPLLLMLTSFPWFDGGADRTLQKPVVPGTLAGVLEALWCGGAPLAPPPPVGGLAAADLGDPLTADLGDPLTADLGDPLTADLGDPLTADLGDLLSPEDSDALEAPSPEPTSVDTMMSVSSMPLDEGSSAPGSSSLFAASGESFAGEPFAGESPGSQPSSGKVRRSSGARPGRYPLEPPASVSPPSELPVVMVATTDQGAAIAAAFERAATRVVPAEPERVLDVVASTGRCVVVVWAPDPLDTLLLASVLPPAVSLLSLVPVTDGRRGRTLRRTATGFELDWPAPAALLRRALAAVRGASIAPPSSA